MFTLVCSAGNVSRWRKRDHVPHVPQVPAVAQPTVIPTPKRLEINNFEVQAVISISVMAFSMGMLATGRGEPSAYLPVLTSVMAYWLPSPTRKE